MLRSSSLTPSIKRPEVLIATVCWSVRTPNAAPLPIRPSSPLTGRLVSNTRRSPLVTVSPVSVHFWRGSTRTVVPCAGARRCGCGVAESGARALWIQVNTADVADGELLALLGKILPEQRVAADQVDEPPCCVPPSRVTSMCSVPSCASSVTGGCPPTKSIIAT